MRVALIFGVVLAAGLAGCTQFPELDATASEGVAEADYPRLLPLEPILQEPPRQATPAELSRVQGNAARLGQRAQGIEPLPIDPGVGSRAERLRARSAALRGDERVVGQRVNRLRQTARGLRDVRVSSSDLAARAARLRAKAARLQTTPF